MMNKNGTGRPKTQYDIEEINEIIEMKLKSVDYNISKVTYNSVFTFNKYLVKTKKRNSKNELFKLYGYSFWAADYRGVPNQGKEQIDLCKRHNHPIIAGESFEVGTDDIKAVIDTNSNNPQKMKQILIKIFQKERNENARNDKKFNELQQKVNTYKKLASQYKQALFMMFYNSRLSENSLNDVMVLKKEGDTYIQNELLHIFDNNQELIEEIVGQKENTYMKEINNSIIDLAKILEGKDQI